MVVRFNRGIQIIILLVVTIVIILMLVNQGYIYRANWIKDMMNTERMNLKLDHSVKPNMKNQIEINIIGN